MLKFLCFAVLLGISDHMLYAQNCKTIDKPDIYYMDSNGDGIDGDTAAAIFVSVSTGNDSNSGHYGYPVASIEKAISLTNAQRMDVYIAAGAYALSNTLLMPDGVSLYGLFNPLSWSRGVLNPVYISGPPTSLRFNGNTLPSMVTGLDITSANATGPGANSIGIQIINCSGTITLLSNRIKAGSGASGNAGINGNIGSNGSNGTGGGFGVCDGSTVGIGGTGGSSACGANGGKGGNGGYKAAGGQIGSNGGGGGGAGGNGGSSGDPGNPGGSGINGGNGINGSNGAANNTSINISMGTYVPTNGQSGSNGTDGKGGGGGGGGGGQDGTFVNPGSGNGGGGGGGGGCRGLAGTGGTGGGASIAVLSSYGNLYMDQNLIITSGGGAGGKGGNGGSGGNGGNGAFGGGFCTSEVGAGGKGGNGGNGGSGGAGSGGNGGPSIGILYAGLNAVYLGNNTFQTGIGGSGGSGGTSAGGNAANGLNGQSNNTYGSMLNSIPKDTVELCMADTIVYRPLSGNKTIRMSLNLSMPSPAAAGISYAATDQTALKGSDYTFSDGTANFDPYYTVKTLEFDVLASADTGSKTFRIQFSNPYGLIKPLRSYADITIKSENSSAIKQQYAGFNLLNAFCHPNPSSGQLMFNLEMPYAGILRIELYDAGGRLVLSGNDTESMAGAILLPLNASELSAGMYQYRILLNGQTSAQGKLVLQP